MDKKIYCSAIIVAAGKGTRMGGNISKQFMLINGKTILEYTLECFNQCLEIDEIIIVMAEECIEFFKNEILYKHNFKKNVKIASGGKERQYSVYNGLKEVNTATDVVLIHDGVRPFIKDIYIKKIIHSAYENTGAVLAVPVKDTIKVVDHFGFIQNTPKRENLWAIQTPQGFKYDILIRAYEKATEDNFIGTDDATLVERLGYRVKIEEGSYNNIKITTSEDLYTAETILQKMH